MDSGNLEESMHDASSGKKPDIWYVFRSIGGIATAVMVAIIGGTGSYVIHSQQEKSSRSHLYTELMSQRENAESAVRKDMFQQILSSFMKNEDGIGCLIDEIDKDLLRLDLLSRNFHEMLDMEPLFVHVLLKIVREIPELKDPESSESVSAGDNGVDADIAKDKNAQCIKKLYNRWKKTSESSTWEDFKTELMKKKLEMLNRTARRITRKQMESLSSVRVRHRLSIDLSKTCQHIKPNDPLSPSCKTCEKDPQGKNEKISLKLEGIGERTFDVLVNQSYPKWNQVKVQVKVGKTEQEKKSDKMGEDWHDAKFWLGYYDFPLAENTLISDKERYAVILDEIDQQKNEAHISLLYFPASYAGLKEKSFYQQKLISTLLKEDGL